MGRTRELGQMQANNGQSANGPTSGQMLAGKAAFQFKVNWKRPLWPGPLLARFDLEFKFLGLDPWAPGRGHRSLCGCGQRGPMGPGPELQNSTIQAKQATTEAAQQVCWAAACVAWLAWIDNE